MSKDNRDPALLGSVLLAMAVLHGSARTAYDRSKFRTPDYDSNPGPLEKYGRPQELPSTLPN